MRHKRGLWLYLFVALVILLLVVWELWFPQPTIARRYPVLEGCSRPVSTEFATLEGVYIFGPEKRFQLIAGDPVNWAAMQRWARESRLPVVNPVIEIDLEWTETRCLPARIPRVLIGTAPPQMIQHLIERLFTWRFSPYRKGSIRYCFDITRHRLKVDTTWLEPTDIKDADQIPIERIWNVQYFDDTRWVRYPTL